MTSRPRLTAGILLAAFGTVVILVGLVLLRQQAADYVDTARWSEHSLLDLIKSPTVKSVLPGGLISWVYRPESLHGLHAAIVGFLDVVSASLFFLSVGAFSLWKALR